MKTFMIMSVFAASVVSFAHSHQEQVSPHKNVMVASAQQERDVSFPTVSKGGDVDKTKSA